MGGRATGSSINKRPLSCRSVAGSQDMELLSSAHGELEAGELQVGDCLEADLHQGSSEATPGSSSTAAPSALSSLMVERQPLPPRLLASVPSGRQATALLNLQAVVPSRRPLCSSGPPRYVPHPDLVGRQGAADRAFDNPMLRPEVATETRKAAARVQARCDAAEELGGVEFRLRVMFIDAFGESASNDEEEDESGSDMEFGEFDLSGARSLQDQQTGAGYEDDDDDEDGCGAQFSVRPYRGGPLAREEGNLLLSGFEARSDGPELTEQHELTSYDMRRLVHLALEGGGSMEDDEAYQRAMAGGGTPVSRASLAAMVNQALQSANQDHQHSRSPSQIFPMRIGF